MSGATADVIRLSRAAAVAIPPTTVAMARLCVLDWFGLAVAGAGEPVSLLIREVALAEGASPVATVIGSETMVSPRQAALINATAGHALDYDDVNLAMHVHPTTVILPPVLALAEARGIGGRVMIEAFVVGYEAAGMIGAWLGAAPYDRGFHMTGTVGCIGAAAACSYLLGLDAAATARAYGLAATQAAGLKAQFGTMAKPLHAGRAAEAGLTAALWAAAGMTSRTDILEAAQGYAATQAAIPPEPIVWLDYALDRNLFKYHAACFGVHGAIDAITLLRVGGLNPDDIYSLRIKVDAGADRMCNIAEPRSGTEAKFSLRFAAALALAGYDTAAPSTFRDELTQLPALIALRDRTIVDLAPPGWPDERTEVAILLKDGRLLSSAKDMSRSPADAARLRTKFDILTQDRLLVGRAAALAAMVSRLERIDDVGALCRSAASIVS